MEDRSRLIQWIRGELIGPAINCKDADIVVFADREFQDDLPFRRGPLAWKPSSKDDLQEVLYYERETPYRKYGAGILHPKGLNIESEDETALAAMDNLGAEPTSDETEGMESPSDPDTDENGTFESSSDSSGDDFEVTSPDVHRPSTIGISFCVKLGKNSQIFIRIPQKKRFAWQDPISDKTFLNGRYEACIHRWTDKRGQDRSNKIWRRLPAIPEGTFIVVDRSELSHNKMIPKEINMPEGSPISLRIEILPRVQNKDDDSWLLTVVLMNSSQQTSTTDPRGSTLYQAFFEVEIHDGAFEKYPESLRPFEELDLEEQSLALLYRESATWGIGHGCAAGWDAAPGETPHSVYADVMPAVELPSMTPEIEADGQPIKLSMRSLANLPDDDKGPEWESLETLALGYEYWIEKRKTEASGLQNRFSGVADRHLSACVECLERIRKGISLLKGNGRVRHAFKLTNLCMLLQQIAGKQLERRPLSYDPSSRLVTPTNDHLSPWYIYQNELEDKTQIGSWRAFQLAYLLMSLDGTHDGESMDREMVDLIWFPTGGGKTEAYLSVMAFYMYHERLTMDDQNSGLRKDGTNVLMRYTLRMLTTQQFQRAASLICAMEFLRRNKLPEGMGAIPGRRFSLGLWIGRDGSPNNIADAKKRMSEFQNGYSNGNPLVITECPWCRAEIGRFNGPCPRKIPKSHWKQLCLRGITDVSGEGPLLHCTDYQCSFGQEFHENWLPIEVIDQRIYRFPPSLVIATADKLAIVAYRPQAGILFGRRIDNLQIEQEYKPPGLIIQDELHLISGPLGTMYALYETIFEKLCSYKVDKKWIKPKVVASTATVRGAAEQVNALYGRKRLQLFPSPGLMMGDSFFGKYARKKDGKLEDGRLYLGIHASDYGSVLTTQVRTFSSALFQPYLLEKKKRDPWWTLLAFYNSIRELGGARTLFDSDIRSRLKFMFNREGYDRDDRRHLRIIEELTSRLSQAEIVSMLDRLYEPYRAGKSSKTIDACLASNIIEVGVDIDRLSLMSVVGQPKTTASYIQVTGRVGRRWWDRPGLILMIYNPSKSRDRSHYEQFHSYHRRLYERVEPTTATPFALSAIQRAAMGAMIVWARQHGVGAVNDKAAYTDFVEECYQLLCRRCREVQEKADLSRSLSELERYRNILLWKWDKNPQLWEEFPQKVNGEYLMLWPGQFASGIQQRNSVSVPSSMRQVDQSGELQITQGYLEDAPPIEENARNTTSNSVNDQ